MKTTSIFRLSALVVLLALLATPLRAAELTTTFTGKDTGVRGASIDNRYGSITVKHSQTKEVSIVAKVTAKAPTERRTAEIIKLVTVKINVSEGVLKAETIRQNYNGRNGESLTTDIEVTLPSGYSLELEQKYGGINFPTSVQQGKTELEMAYGSINGGTFEGEFSLDAKYGSISIDKIARGSIDVEYCNETNVNEIGWLKAELSYSKLKTNSVQQLEGEMKYSEIIARQAGQITLEGKYSKLDIGTLNKSLVVEEFGYSKLSIGQVAAGVDRIVVNNLGYGSAEVNLSGLSKLSLELGNERFSNYLVSETVKTKASGGGGARIHFTGNFSNVKLK